MTTFRPDGIFTAMVTPFTADGALDLAAARKAVAWQVEQGVPGIVPLGGTGEPLSLDVDEQKRLIDAVVEEAGNRTQVVVGALCASPRDIVEVGRHAARAGAAAVMLIPPYFVMATPRHVLRHFADVAARVDLPLVLYHGPQRSGVRLPIDTVLELIATVPRFVAVKDTTGDAYFLASLVRQAPRDFAVLSGWDELVFPTLALGGRGAVLSLGCLIPKLFARIYDAFHAGRFDEARALQYDVLPLCAAIYAEPNPSPLKKALELVGRPAGPTRPPLYAPSDATVATLESLLPAFRAYAG
jgi:4-hydroxy-tetrahydrodipicolinate synthase